MKTMDSAGGPNPHEGKMTFADLEVRDDESQNILSLCFGEIDKCWCLTNINTKMIDKNKSELDPLLPNNGLWLSVHDDEKVSTGAQAMASESVCNMVLQILAPFLLAGFGTVMAGMLLDIVQHWDVFRNVTEIFILVPALLGMKGNLEMTLASRLSTVVNVGKINSSREMWKLIIGNLALKQVQATVLGLLAALAASVLGWLLEEKLTINYTALLCCSSVVTAFMASLLQGIIMVGVIIVSKRTGINPDNVAAPIAASFGDLITLGLLAIISQRLFYCIELYPYVIYVVCVIFLCLTPIWVTLSFCHSESHKLLYNGWEPIITAMVISSMGGLILDKTITDSNLGGAVVYAPVINGVGGNLAAIQSSRIATYLHFHCSLGSLPDDAKRFYCPFRTFYGKGYNNRTARVLLFLAIPGHVVFLFIIYLMQGANTSPTPTFIILYLIAALTQVFLLLCIADWMVHCLWKYGRDPDSFSIPYLTALGDLLGTGLLALCVFSLGN
ncbi:solute carrier family 41 member 2 isoform X1 [Tachysurus fulvidraco]|uniref:solute carrier family 41 member 2 isoform X1 n=1 Tax=Tachysurus fulvidraco TaxID=1234273 RepID=UPI001FEDAFD6|nr:solute carrier family 41 member 2 isoform X1 [Tachysurus fulvidraco]